MAGLESIVRPFVRPDSLTTRRIVSSREKVEVEPAIKSWGKPGNIDPDELLAFARERHGGKIDADVRREFVALFVAKKYGTEH